MQHIVDGMSFIFDVMKYSVVVRYFLINIEDLKRDWKSTVPFIEQFLECMAGTYRDIVILIGKS